MNCITFFILLPIFEQNLLMIVYQMILKKDRDVAFKLKENIQGHEGSTFVGIVKRMLFQIFITYKSTKSWYVSLYSCKD